MGGGIKGGRTGGGSGEDLVVGSLRRVISGGAVTCISGRVDHMTTDASCLYHLLAGVSVRQGLEVDVYT